MIVPLVGRSFLLRRRLRANQIAIPAHTNKRQIAPATAPAMIATDDDDVLSIRSLTVTSITSSADRTATEVVVVVSLMLVMMLPMPVASVSSIDESLAVDVVVDVVGDVFSCEPTDEFGGVFAVTVAFMIVMGVIINDVGTLADVWLAVGCWGVVAGALEDGGGVESLVDWAVVDDGVMTTFDEVALGDGDVVVGAGDGVVTGGVVCGAVFGEGVDGSVADGVGEGVGDGVGKGVGEGVSDVVGDGVGGGAGKGVGTSIAGKGVG